MSDFWIIENGSVTVKTAEEVTDLITHMASGHLVMGYDMHAGFNIPESNLDDLLKDTEKTVKIEPAIIDENEQWGKAFSPHQVTFTLQGVQRRVRVSGSAGKSVYVSQIPVNYESILGGYAQLSPSALAEAKPLIENVRLHNPNSLGDFIALLHYEIIKRTVREHELMPVRFDSHTVGHPESVHAEHDLLYIALSKLAAAQLTRKPVGELYHPLDYLAKKFDNIQREGKNPRLVITPINPIMYFRGE